MSIFIGELIGTMLLVLLGNGVVSNVLLKKSKGENAGWIVISAGWGFAVAIGVYSTGWATGGHINPAVTLGLALLGKIQWNLTPIYFIGQLVGGVIGAVLVWLAYFPHWKETRNANNKLLCFSTQPAIRKPVWNFCTEVIGTAVLLLAVLAIFNVNNSVGTGFAPYLVGIAVFSIGLSLGGPTGFAINPARDLGPRIAHAVLPISGKGKSDWKYAWIPVFGPLVGGALGAAIYHCFVEQLKVL